LYPSKAKGDEKLKVLALVYSHIDSIESYKLREMIFWYTIWNQNSTTIYIVKAI